MRQGRIERVQIQGGDISHGYAGVEKRVLARPWDIIANPSR